MVAHKPHNRRADFGTRPEAACLDRPHERHVVVQLHPHPRKTSRLGTGRGGEALGHLRLHQHHHRFGNRRHALDQLQQDARAGLIGQVGDKRREAVAHAVLDEVERVALEDGQGGRRTERVRQAVGQHGVLLDGRHGVTARKQAFRQHAQSGADLQHMDGRGKAGGIENRLEGVAVDEKVLPERAVRVEAVCDAPGLDLAGTRQVHFVSFDSGIGYVFTNAWARRRFIQASYSSFAVAAFTLRAISS